MANELTIYERFSDPLVAIEKLGDWVAKSRLVNCATLEQGRVLAMEALMRRTTVLTLFQDFHVTDTGLSMRADAMLRRFRKAGGNHRVIERTDEAAEIEVTRPDGEKYRERFTWKQAEKEPFPFKKDGACKTNWATPRARAQMLWARVVSEVIGYAMPEVKEGYYTPEEIADEVVEGNGHVDAVDAEFEPVKPAEPEKQPPAPAATTATPPATPAPDAGLCTAEQRSQINALFGSLNATDAQRSAILAKRGVNLVRGLSETQAAALILTLSIKARETAGKDSFTWAPASDVVVADIKDALKGAGDASLVATIKEHLTRHGKTKIAELSQVDAERLLTALQAKNLESFLSQSLQSPPEKASDDSDIPF